MKTRLSVPLVVALSLIVSHARAATIVVPSDPGDGQVDVNGVPVDIPLTEVRPGTGGGSETTVVRGQASVFFFALPTLSPSTISSADVQWSFLGYEGSPEFNLDVFGLGVRSTATMLSSDYYAGNSAGGSGTVLQTGFLTPSASPGNFQVSLGGYLQSLYNPSGVPLGNFLVLRINPDITLPSPNPPMRGYYLGTSDNPNASLVPELTINTVPEPSTLVLAVLGGLGLLAFRRVAARKRAA
jgi:hypothetical protein